MREILLQIIALEDCKCKNLPRKGMSIYVIPCRSVSTAAIKMFSLLLQNQNILFDLYFLVHSETFKQPQNFSK